MANPNRMGMSVEQLRRSRAARFGNNRRPLSDEWNELYDRFANRELSREEFMAEFNRLLEEERS